MGVAPESPVSLATTTNREPTAFGITPSDRAPEKPAKQIGARISDVEREEELAELEHEVDDV